MDSRTFSHQAARGEHGCTSNAAAHARGPSWHPAVGKLSRAHHLARAAAVDGLHRTRLAEACALLDPDEERALAEEGLAADVDFWPEY